MPALSLLAISDGTTTISLLNSIGFVLQDWRPSRPQFKGSGVWADPVMGTGRQLTMTNYDNVIDTFTVIAQHETQDALFQESQEADRLLLKAVSYWTSSWQTEPVYLIARGSEETNIRYATIKSYQLAGDSSPYAQPVFSHIDKPGQTMTFVIEHDIWQDVIPGTATTIARSAQQEYDGVTYGQAATDSDTVDVFVANKHNTANITHIYNWTAGPVWSANLFGGVLPFDIFPGGAGGPLNGDIVYFGCDTSGAPDDSGPFCSLVFDIETAATYGAGDSVQWQYYNGAGAWFNFPATTITDNTNATNPAIDNQPFTETGINAIVFKQPADWRTVAAAPAVGITGYWVRFVITVATGITRTRQWNRDVYSIVWAGVDIDELQVPGDMPALIRLDAHGVSHPVVDPTLASGAICRIIAGLRSKSKGENFRPYINLNTGVAAEQNPAGVGVGIDGANVNSTVIPPAGGVRETTEPAAQYAVVYEVAGVTAMTKELHVTLSGSAPTYILNEYYGKYRAFVRYKSELGTSGDVRMMAQITSGGTGTPVIWQSEIVDLNADSIWSVADLGRLEIPGYGVDKLGLNVRGSVGLWQIEFYIETTVAVAQRVFLYDLILIPADEWLGEFNAPIVLYSGLANKVFCSIDSTIPFYDIVAPQRSYEYPTSMTNRWTTEAVGPIILQANADQKLWFFMMRYDSVSDEIRYAEMEKVLGIRLQKVSRYTAMRGAR